MIMFHSKSVVSERSHIEQIMLLIMNVDRIFRNEKIFLNIAKTYLTPT